MDNISAFPQLPLKPLYLHDHVLDARPDRASPRTQQYKPQNLCPISGKALMGLNYKFVSWDDTARTEYFFFLTQIHNLANTEGEERVIQSNPICIWDNIYPWQLESSLL